jgi:hypothetical protein
MTRPTPTETVVNPRQKLLFLLTKSNSFWSSEHTQSVGISNMSYAFCGGFHSCLKATTPFEFATHLHQLTFQCFDTNHGSTAAHWIWSIRLMEVLLTAQCEPGGLPAKYPPMAWPTFPPSVLPSVTETSEKMLFS